MQMQTISSLRTRTEHANLPGTQPASGYRRTYYCHYTPPHTATKASAQPTDPQRLRIRRHCCSKNPAACSVLHEKALAGPADKCGRTRRC